MADINDRSKQWTLTLHPTHLSLNELPDPQPYIILRDQVLRTAILMEGTRTFVLQKPLKAMFKLAPEAAATLAEWIGKPVLAGIYLARRYAWVLPIAILWIFGSLPFDGV